MVCPILKESAINLFDITVCVQGIGMNKSAELKCRTEVQNRRAEVKMSTMKSGAVPAFS